MMLATMPWWVVAMYPANIAATSKILRGAACAQGTSRQTQSPTSTRGCVERALSRQCCRGCRGFGWWWVHLCRLAGLASRASGADGKSSSYVEPRVDRMSAIPPSPRKPAPVPCRQRIFRVAGSGSSLPPRGGGGVSTEGCNPRGLRRKERLWCAWWRWWGVVRWLCVGRSECSFFVSAVRCCC